MSMLIEDQVSSFLDRFHHCYDGLVRAISILFASGNSLSTAKIVISVRDATDPASWVNVHLELDGLKEFALREGQASYQVLSDGLKIGFFGDLIFLDFAPYTDDPDGVEDFRRSEFYFASRSCKWQVHPYQD